MSERWVQYIRDTIQKSGGLIPYAAEYWGYTLPIRQAIKEQVKPPAKILEVGCGAAILAILLHEQGYRVVAVDEDPEIIKIAQDSAKCFRSSLIIEQASAFDLSRYHEMFDLTFSLGLIEHFDRQTTIRLLQEQAKCSPLVLAGIPTKYTTYVARITDERFYTLREFKKIFREAGFEILKSFVHCDVPSKLSTNLERALPGAVHRFMQRQLSYAIGQCCLGRWRGSAPGG